jgi:hypothetical protein
MEYQALTNQGFLFQETLRVARLVSRGSSRAALLHAMLEENLLELRSRQTRKTVAAALLERLRDLPAGFVTQLLSTTPDAQRALVLLLIARRHRLLAETLAELHRGQAIGSTVTASSLRGFFVRARLEDARLSAWSDATFQKSVGNIVKFLREARLIEARGQDWTLRAPLLSDTDRCAICATFGVWGLRALLQPQQGGAL